MEKSSFAEAYSQLNTEQRKAVDNIDGPLLVIAGPGTGKTQLLSTRAANILKKTDTSPENILCLTFTNKAAINMRDRLIKLIGASASSINVKTFHSFAGEIMNQYPEFFWSGARLTTVPESVQLEIVQSIQSQFPLDNPLAMKFAGQFTGTRDVMEGLRLAKEAGLTPGKLETIIKANLEYIDVLEPELSEILDAKLNFKTLEVLRNRIADLPKLEVTELIAPLQPLDQVLIDSLNHAIFLDKEIGKTTNTGKWKRRWMQTVDGQKGMFDERKRNNWWLELAGFYSKYRDTLHSRGYYDYSDMLVEVIDQLENQPELLANIQEQYLYVMIDEFQDTNAAQLRLAHLIADHYANNGQPNLMVVGDDDQSIFKFNGAELNNMLGFRKSYTINKPIVLTKNYRSTQAILDTAKLVAEQASDRIVNREPDITKELISTTSRKYDSKIEHLVFEARELQYSLVAKQIQASFTDSSSVAVLARKHESLRSLAAILHSLNVPLRYEKQNDILGNEAVSQVCMLAKIVLAIRNGDQNTINSNLSKLLCHSAWDIDSTTLWKLAIQNRHSGNWLESISLHNDERLKNLGNWLTWLSKKSVSLPLPLIIEYLLGLKDAEHFTCPIKDYYIRSAGLDQAYIETLSAIQKLRQLVDDFSFKQQPTLEDFVRFVDINNHNERTVSDESVFVTSEHAVQLLTVHKAKGLEFDTVYIIDAIDKDWKPRSGGRKTPANLPLQPYGDDYDDYVRLMYVAITRAKQKVFITSFNTNAAGEEVLATPIISTIVEKNEIHAKTSDVIDSLEKSLTWPELNTSSKRHLLKPILENYQLPVTALLNFLDVTKGGPSYFEQRNLLRLPESKTIHESYGTAMHTALEKGQYLTNKSRFSLENVIESFKSAMRDENLDVDEMNRYIDKGEQVLKRLFLDYDYKLQKGSQQEQKLGDVLIGQARLSGKLDRIDSYNDKLVIVDYKTGKPLSSFETKDQTKAIKAWRQKTQLIYYAVLASHSPRYKKYKSIECQMVYVEAEIITQLSRTYIPTEQDIKYLELLISRVWAKIQKLDFPNTDVYPKDISGIQSFQQDLLDNSI